MRHLCSIVSSNKDNPWVDWIRKNFIKGRKEIPEPSDASWCWSKKNTYSWGALFISFFGFNYWTLWDFIGMKS